MFFSRTTTNGGDSYGFLNGDWGTADANTGALGTLEDGTRTGGSAWTTNEWAGCVVKITAGPGSEETQNWRTISANDGNTLTISPDWEIEHTTSTNYVILGSNKWTEQYNLAAYTSDIAVAGDHV